MFPTDFLIFLRERFLDIVSGSDRSETLNQEGTHDTDSSGGDLAAELIHLLHEVLSSGWVIHDENVDFAALHTSPLYEDFLSCTGKLSTFDPSNSDAQLTFWINLYNILVLHGVIALNVRCSVMERRMGLRFFRQAAYIVGGQRMSGDDIEHGILRANRGHPFFPGRQFGPSDPRLKWVIKPFDMRVHFTLNCASRNNIRHHDSQTHLKNARLIDFTFCNCTAVIDKMRTAPTISAVHEARFITAFEKHKVSQILIAAPDVPSLFVRESCPR